MIIKHGGRRSGSGRPTGSGKYSCPTKPIRVPIDMIDKIEKFIHNKAYDLPIYSNRVSAGFPSPADDHVEGRLDLNEYLIRHPAATFFVRVSGDSMSGAGINPGDILVVDRSLEAKHNKIVIAVVNSELTVKRLYKTATSIKLLPENTNYRPINITQETEFKIWGVVTSVIKEF